jgi:uncharacterized membrane protein
MNVESNAAAGAPATAKRGLVEYTYSIYALQASTLICAGLTMPLPALRFAFCLPSLLGFLLNWWRRTDVQGTWLASHFSWQIRTFWYACLWAVCTSIIAIPLLLFGHFVVSLAAFALIALWMLYRIVRGAIALHGGQAAPLSMV